MIRLSNQVVVCAVAVVVIGAGSFAARSLASVSASRLQNRLVQTSASIRAVNTFDPMPRFDDEQNTIDRLCVSILFLAECALTAMR